MLTRIMVMVSMLSASAAAMGDLVNHTDVSGANYDFTNISEFSGTDTIGPDGLYRQPSVSVNSLVFTPQGFTALGSGGTGDITDVQLNFDVTRKANSTISAFYFRESGDYNMFGGTFNTFVRVTCGINITVLETTAGPVSVPALSGTLWFTPVGSVSVPTGTEYHQTVDPSSNVWEGFGAFDISAWLAMNSIPGNATKINIALDNTLVAVTESGSLAFIAKKTFGGVVIDVVPAPSSLALLGLGGLVATRRRR